MMKNSKKLIQSNFKNDKDQPFEITEGQKEIVDAIWFKKNPRTQIIAPTQYGKSTTIAMALICRSQGFKEDWAIVTGEQKKSDIIMGQVIEHLFDNPILLDNLDIDSKEPLDRIRRERSKKRITWKDGGSITSITASSTNRRRVKESLSGLGSPNIIEDEASLIPDDLQAMVLRMLGGHKGGTLIKIGNPYTRGHFLKTWTSPKYHKVFIDYKQALKEGRYTEEFVEEMRSEAFFDILYECKFPPEDEIDMGGFVRLLTDGEIAGAGTDAKPSGNLKLGFDVGEGGDENIGIIQDKKVAQVVHKSRIKDLMATVRVIQDLIEEHDIEPEDCFVDATGIGSGVVARLHEIGLEVTGVKWASKPTQDTFKNLKAENFWTARTLIKEGMKLYSGNDWTQLQDIKYKTDTTGKIQIKSKEDMRKDGISSPDIADALALSCNKSIEETAPNIIVIG